MSASVRKCQQALVIIRKTNILYFSFEKRSIPTDSIVIFYLSFSMLS